MSSTLRQYRQRRLLKDEDMWNNTQFSSCFGKTVIPFHRHQGNKGVEDVTSTIHIEFCSPLGKKYDIFLPPEYPFKPPHILEQKKEYEKHSHLDSFCDEIQQKFYHEYHQLFQECGHRCCRSILYQSRWSPCRALIHVVQEILTEESRWYTILCRWLRKVIISQDELPTEIISHISLFL